MCLINLHQIEILFSKVAAWFRFADCETLLDAHNEKLFGVIASLIKVHLYYFVVPIALKKVNFVRILSKICRKQRITIQRLL